MAESLMMTAWRCSPLDRAHTEDGNPTPFYLQTEYISFSLLSGIPCMRRLKGFCLSRVYRILSFRTHMRTINRQDGGVGVSLVVQVRGILTPRNAPDFLGKWRKQLGCQASRFHAQKKYISDATCSAGKVTQRCWRGIDLSCSLLLSSMFFEGGRGNTRFRAISHHPKSRCSVGDEEPHGGCANAQVGDKIGCTLNPLSSFLGV